MESENIFERTLVASISTGEEGDTGTYRNCWVSIRHMDQLVDVWLTEGGGRPDLTLPLSAINIQWTSLPRRMDLDES